MTHPLDGCFAKLARAKKQIVEFNGLFQNYLETGFDFIESDPDAITFTRVDAPPLELGTIVGDIAHNLRSSLDNLMHALTHQNPTMPVGIQDFESDRVAFPIVKEEGSFPSLNNRSLMGLSASAYNEIRLVQPFQDPYDRAVFPLAPQKEVDVSQPYVATTHPLWLLHAINNIDKHRQVHVLVLSPLSIVTAPVGERPEMLDLPLGTLSEGLTIENVHGLRANPGGRTVMCHLAFASDCDDAKHLLVLPTLMYIEAFVRHCVIETPGMLNLFPPKNWP